MIHRVEREAGRRPLELSSTITCPVCGTAKVEIMPTNACRIFYLRTGCATLLRSEPADCCVFCSYSDRACPPVQARGQPAR